MYDEFDEEKDELTDEMRKVFDDNTIEMLDSFEPQIWPVATGVKIEQVDSPFILADNNFDIESINNETRTFGVKQVKYVGFTGGACYVVYEKDAKVDRGYIVHGNEGEGYNIFVLS